MKVIVKDHGAGLTKELISMLLGSAQAKPVAT